MSDLGFNFSDLDGNAEVDQVRTLRLVLQALDDDFAQGAAIAHELAKDPRGKELATWHLIAALSVGLARQWVVGIQHDDESTESAAQNLRETIQQFLLKAGAQNG